MRWGRWILGGVVLLLVAGALVFYFAFVPGIVASDWKDHARAAHERAADAMKDTYATFTPLTFGTTTRAVRRAKNIDQYVRALGALSAASRDRLDAARSQITNTSNSLADAHRDDSLKAPSWPLISGSGDLEKVDELARLERKYLDRADAFLDEYDRLALYVKALVGFATRTGEGLGHGVSQLPKNASTPEEFARPVDRIAATLEREVRVFKKRKAPREMRRDRATALSLASYYARELRGFADDVRARNLARVQTFDRRFSAGARRYRRRASGTLAHLMRRSKYAREIERLRRLERRIEDGYEEL